MELPVDQNTAISSSMKPVGGIKTPIPQASRKTHKLIKAVKTVKATGPIHAGAVTIYVVVDSQEMKSYYRTGTSVRSPYVIACNPNCPHHLGPGIEQGEYGKSLIVMQENFADNPDLATVFNCPAIIRCDASIRKKWVEVSEKYSLGPNARLEPRISVMPESWSTPLINLLYHVVTDIENLNPHASPWREIRDELGHALYKELYMCQR